MTEVALIVEARGGGNLSDRVFTLGQSLHGPLETQLTQILAYSRTKVLLERAGEMCRMHAHSVSDLDQIEWIVEASVQQIARLAEPTRRSQRHRRERS